MKAKWILGILAVSLAWSIFSNSQGTDRFYYGTYGGRYEQDFPSIKDSLKFNIVYSYGSETSVQYLAQNGLRAIAGGLVTNSPALWASQSHYTMWEAEGYPSSHYGFTYSGGTLSSDASASGGKAQVFTPYVDQAGLIQTGPDYDQEFKKSPEDSILYTAKFRIKSPIYNPRSMGVGDDTLCVLMVVGEDSLLAQRIVYTSSFKNCFGYKEFDLNYYATHSPTEFRIYWPGRRVLGIDYVKVYDRFGRDLIDDSTHMVAQNIKNYVSQDWVKTTIPETGDTVVYRWYLADEPSYIDLFEPNRYVDSLLREVSAERVGFQAFRMWWINNLEDDYFLRVNPEEYNPDFYFTGYWGPGYSGPDF